MLIDMRAKSEMLGRKSKRHLRLLRAEAAGDVEFVADIPRPRTRGDCAKIPRPCPFVTCRHSNFSDVNRQTGTIKYNFVDPESMPADASCSLDVADGGGLQLAAIGALYGLSRERIRQIQDEALSKLLAHVKISGQRRGMEEHLAEAEARGARGTPLALAQEPTDFVGTTYPVPGVAAEEPEQAERRWLPTYPSIFDESVSDEQYGEAFRALWDRVKARRAERVPGPGMSQVAESTGEDGAGQPPAKG